MEPWVVIVISLLVGMVAGIVALVVGTMFQRQFADLATTRFQKELAESRGDLEKRQQSIEQMVKPIERLLEEQRRALGGLEQKAVDTTAVMRTEIKNLVSVQGDLRRETQQLATALRHPGTRGAWGEMGLRNIVELSGMVEHCDFEEQVALDGIRPDMTIRLPGGGTIVLDSKVPLDRFLDAVEATEDRRSILLEEHAAAVEQHVRSLSRKAYWAQFELAPEFVVMFLRVEASFVAAVEQKKDLQERAIRQNVLLATPTLLVAMLRTISVGWQQQALARNAREIATKGTELLDRLATFAEHFNGLGAKIDGVVEAYDECVGSYVARLLPSARTLHDLSGRTDVTPDEPPPLHLQTRRIRALGIDSGDEDRDRSS